MATPTSSSLPQSSNQSTGLRDFFLQYLQKTTPHKASLGESLTAADALERQKNIEDEKKRKELEKEERKILRITKKAQEEKKKENKKN